MFRLLRGLVVYTDGSTMKVELENGLIVEAKNQGGFRHYQTVEVAYNFERREVVCVEKRSKNRLEQEESEMLSEGSPVEVCNWHASEALDTPMRVMTVDAYSPDDFDISGDLAPDGAEVEAFEDPGPEVEVEG